MKEVKTIFSKLDQITPTIQMVKEEKDKSRFIIEPLSPGFGIILGNSLRRILLSSLKGSAVTAVKIKGISHQFSTLPNVKEDVIQIILNLKGLLVKLDSDDPRTLKLKVHGPRKVTAKDIKTPSGVEIINPDLLIATLDNNKAELDMEMLVEKGVGYSPVEERKEIKLPIGMIPVDACFTPVRKVAFDIENTRVGEMTNLDKLILNIETNGVINPEEALKEAAKILVDQFSLFLAPQKSTVKTKKEPQKTIKPEKILVEEIDLSPRTTNALLKHKVKNVGQILKLKAEGLKGLKGLGKSALAEIKMKLKELGLTLPEKEE